MHSGVHSGSGFQQTYQALEPNGFICASPGQGRLCGRRPGLGMPTTLQAEGLLHRLPSRLATNDADFQPAVIVTSFPRASPDPSELPWANIDKPFGLLRKRRKIQAFWLFASHLMLVC